MSSKCHDYLGCKETECLMFNDEEKRNCWDIDPTLTPCTDTVLGPLRMEDKIVFCRNCLFYGHVNKSV